jgi:hypothetical protein
MRTETLALDNGILLVTLNRLEAANVRNTALEDWHALGRGTAR